MDRRAAGRRAGRGRRGRSSRPATIRGRCARPPRPARGCGRCSRTSDVAARASGSSWPRRAGVRPPPELVPDLLDHAVGAPSCTRPSASAAGPLGRWLAEREPRWAFVRGAADDVDAVWADGGRAGAAGAARAAAPHRPGARRASCSRARSPRRPGRTARRSSTCSTIGLSDADEPLLEAALDDRRKPVRDAAAALLRRAARARAFAARMADAHAPLLRVEDGALVVDAARPAGRGGAARRGRARAAGARSACSALLAGDAARHLGRSSSSPCPCADDLARRRPRGLGRGGDRQRDVEWARALWRGRTTRAARASLPRDEAEALAAARRGPVQRRARRCPGRGGRSCRSAVIDAIQRAPRGGERGQDVAFAGLPARSRARAEAEDRCATSAAATSGRLCDMLAHPGCHAARSCRDRRDATPPARTPSSSTPTSWRRWSAPTTARGRRSGGSRRGR